MGRTSTVRKSRPRDAATKVAEHRLSGPIPVWMLPPALARAGQRACGHSERPLPHDS